MQPVWKMDVSNLELQTDDLLERARGVDVQVLRSAKEAHTGEKAISPK